MLSNGPKGAQRNIAFCFEGCAILLDIKNMDILEKIFGSQAKVKIMRLFLFNPNAPFDLEQVIERTKTTPQAARLNIRVLRDSSLIKPRTFVREVRVEKKTKVPKPGKAGKGGKAGKKLKAKDTKTGNANKSILVKKRVSGWILNETFSYLVALQSFLVQASPLQDQLIARKLSRTGKIKLLIISGVFIQDKDSRVDILVVGDELRRGAIDSAIRDMEAELGKDLTYSVFETTDFNYRLGMYDKLIRDILDYPHKKLINRLAI